MLAGTSIRSSLRYVLPVTLLAATAMTTIGMAPEPDPVAKKWELEVTPGPLRMATINTPGKTPQRYFYLTYKVTNKTSQDVLFAPSFDLVTDDGSISRSGRDVPGDVTKKIINDLGNSQLLDQISIVGTLLQGDENAEEGVVIWPANDLSLNEISIFGAGFSGETKAVQIPTSDPAKKVDVTLRKALCLRYAVHGEITGMSAGDEFEVAEQRWVMR